MCNYLELLEDRPEIVGVDIKGVPPTGCDSFHQMDLSSPGDVNNVIKKCRPDHVLHFSGIFSTRDLQRMYQANFLSAISLLEASRNYAPKAVFVAVGSAAEYGHCEHDQAPITEEACCRPITAYGLSKLLATQATQYYSRVHGLCTMVVRPFQLIGKGLSSDLAPGAFSEQLRKAIASGSGVIRVGNLESYRDFLDIEDAVRGIWMLCLKPASGEVFNLCSGQPTKTAELLEMMVQSSGVAVTVERDVELFRPEADVSKVFGSYEKVFRHCGWRPMRKLSEGVKAILE
jgi:GDP-4-dehydro-6-deoxy-D-mannose reductase